MLGEGLEADAAATLERDGIDVSGVERRA